jgi:hypothetical protein
MSGRMLLRAAVVFGALILVQAAMAAGGFTPGSDGFGDPMFPLAGNGGYDVANYSLTLDYTPSGNRLVGTVVITARATQNLSSFDLDFRMHDVTRLLVKGVPAAFSYAKEQELVVTPAAGLVVGPREVVHELECSAHGRLVAEAAVWSAVIVEVEPGG